MWQAIKEELKPLDAQRVCSGGIGSQNNLPDINHVNGWLELKRVRDDRWPQKGRPVRLANMNRWQDQAKWILHRCMAGGIVHVLLTCGDEWLLFDGITAARRLGYAMEAELKRDCLWLADHPPRLEDVLQWMKP
jgi:hypothetical protein